MKISKEFINGFIMFIGIGVYFLLMEVLGLSKYYVLRIFNVLIVIYGLNLTIKSNIKNGKTGYMPNLISSALTGLIGITLGIIGLAIYLDIMGGQAYMNKLSKAFLFGGNPELGSYCLGLFIEGIASVMMVVFINMQYWRTKEVFKEEA